MDRSITEQPESVGGIAELYLGNILYALERCGDLGRREVIGGRSWFFEGATYLLAEQRKDGAFVDETCMSPKDVLGTAFALLFLTRAHKPVSGGG